MSTQVLSIGAVCFGVVVGYITYRTLARKESAAITDLAAVIAAIGGGTVTTLFIEELGTDAFGWYSIGLVAGFFIYLGLSLAIRGAKETGTIMGVGAESEGGLPGD